MKSNYFLRKFFVTATLIFIGQGLFAQQNWDTLSWKNYSDYKMQNLNKTFVTTNILYDRMFRLPNVDEYTGLPAASNMDTTHPDHLM